MSKRKSIMGQKESVQEGPHSMALVCRSVFWPCSHGSLMPEGDLGSFHCKSWHYSGLHFCKRE